MWQKKQRFAPKCQLAIKQEVDKLMADSFIREVDYPDWLANMVLVKKANGKWWVCINFIDLNKAYPKDSFSLLKIDQPIDAKVG